MVIILDSKKAFWITRTRTRIFSNFLNIQKIISYILTVVNWILCCVVCQIVRRRSLMYPLYLFTSLNLNYIKIKRSGDLLELYNFRNADFCGIYNALAVVDRSFLQAYDVNDAETKFYQVVYRIFDGYAPSKSSPIYPPNFSSEIIANIKIKHFYRKFRRGVSSTILISLPERLS